ncbi:cyclopropane-fatty-acyl-phospholipid synthase family protein [uncultured Aureimonas sp.]|uniref:SAM-dependent methyltransferase n=1 Tax=uncultured Aureimonas sp. TaxID=1604662 RepID=UPI0025E85CEA|nr:cyclopropane-fatty-acyl-phospholipid synthase family protein [uncultured Aureimonas sp.]
MTSSPAPSPDEARVAAAIGDLVRTLDPGFPIVLWTGERIGAPDGPALLVRRADAVARLAFSPRVETLLGFWMDGTIDVVDGSFLDLAGRRGARAKAKGAWKKLDKRRLVTLLPALWRLRKSGPAAIAEAGADAGASGSTKQAIQYHYDVSNRFYELFLDRRMVYSCAYFDGWHDDIDKAQEDKLEMICRKLRLQPGERFLDIGCGWGALLIHAASRHGVTGHGVTLSKAQFDLATRRVREAGLEDRITIELKPYQELTGTFDKIASIGMFEHVGFKNHDAYFGAVRKLLRPRGLYLHHTIARPAKRDLKTFHKGSREYRAITRFIFPGGELDYIGHSLQKLEAHRFEVHDVENWREHYGRTCRIWAERLEANFEAAAAEAGAPVTRLWLLYLAGCALAFERGTVMINQTLVSKRDKGPSGLPPTRADLYA